jgi:hypothetical protein
MENPEKLVTLGTQDEEKQKWIFVLCTQCYKFLWIVHSCFSSSCVPNVTCFSGLSIFVFLRLVYPMLQVSLDCPLLFVFVLCTHCYKFLWIVHSCFSSSCVPNVTSFSGLSILVFLRLVYPMLQVSLDCLFLFVFVLCTQCCKFLWIVHSSLNKNRQSRETCNIGYTRRRKTRMDNPEKLVTLGTQDEDKQEWTIQRNL